MVKILVRLILRLHRWRLRRRINIEEWHPKLSKQLDLVEALINDGK
jgi:hypothetical protein